MSGLHTPGPWLIAGIHQTGFYGNAGEAMVTAPETRIATIDCHTKFKRGDGYLTKCAERDANALLIAAAPELFEALRRVLADEDVALSRPDFEFARAAIAKATST